MKVWKRNLLFKGGSVDGRNPAPVEVGIFLPLFFHGFVHPRWCRISSINSIFRFQLVHPRSLTAKAPEKWWFGRRSGFLLGFGHFSGVNSLLNFGGVLFFTTWDVQNLINNGIDYTYQLVQDFFHQQYFQIPAVIFQGYNYCKTRAVHRSYPP